MRSARASRNCSRRGMRRGARGTSRSPTASATSCCRAELFWSTLQQEPAGGGSRLLGCWVAGLLSCLASSNPATEQPSNRVTMISYLQGALKKLDAARATVVTNGVGYEVHISLQTYYKLEGQREASLEIYTHVREDTLALYGFATGEEKFAFETLISISGLGPTLAQKILSGIEPSDLAEAIAQNDTRKLSSIPGVGKKTADRICLELREKLVLPKTARG